MRANVEIAGENVGKEMKEKENECEEKSHADEVSNGEREEDLSLVCSILVQKCSDMRCDDGTTGMGTTGRRT